MDKALELCAKMLNQAIEYRKTSEYYKVQGDKEAAKRHAYKSEGVSESEAVACKWFGFTFMEVVEAAVTLDAEQSKPRTET
ncbi:hypothetical protein FLT15_16865 [Paenibacillus thiaminolyticus]|uniref:hypothetical protein n=1 Tax=Paenibacillus thiaminolyticus TaxID=49283 RepID=UPI00116207BD|nr:hypothetical protein [Paenibacillus thiaminolyticus]NGP59917.1 hypothetical protein [Paenibacillus thiaminolyticus]NGP59962.1 hypothetical protein [Paenibacillus thiaminolyticus]